MDTAKTLLLVYQSTTGATEQMAQAVATAAQTEGGVTVRLLRAAEAQVVQVRSDFLPSLGLTYRNSDARDETQGRPVDRNVRRSDSGTFSVSISRNS